MHAVLLSAADWIATNPLDLKGYGEGQAAGCGSEYGLSWGAGCAYGAGGAGLGWKGNACEQLFWI